MSAHIQDRAHFLAIIRTALEGPADPREVSPDNVWNGVRWYAVPDRELRDIDWRQLALFTRRLDYDTAEETAALLYDENVASVRYRYDDADDAGLIPQQPPFTVADIRRGRRLTAVDALCAIQGLEYQSCEHPEWADGEARRFLAAFQRELAGFLTKDSSCWSIRDTVQA
jgi:hypothetical protein